MGLCLTVKYGEFILINDTKIYIVKLTGGACRVKIEAPENTSIKRQGWEERMDKMSHAAFVKLSEQEQQFIIRNIKTKMELYLSVGKTIQDAQALVSNELQISGRVVADHSSSMKFSNRKLWLKK